jgi:bifunctional ADP-heptose synthase (sugar kinase/adenylyltransferase)
MYHTEVIQLVEKWLADPESVAKEELKSAENAARAAARAEAIAVMFDPRAAAYAVYWAARAATTNDATEAKEQVEEYHELTKDSD